MRRLRKGFEDLWDGECAILHMPNAEAAITADKRERNVWPRCAGPVGHFDHAAKRFRRSILAAASLPPGLGLQNLEEFTVLDSFRHRQRRYERLASQEQRPDGAAEGGVQPLQKRQVPFDFEADQKVGVSKIESLAQNRLLDALGRVGAADVLGGVVVPHESAFAVHPDGH
jgi:hypothetical protein